MSLRTDRKAVTLTEVLIAIFLMGIGLMAILSLFPLGASQMAQALQDQRAAEAATTADAMGRVILKQTFDDTENNGDTGTVRFVDMNSSHYKPYNTNTSIYSAPHDTMASPAPQSEQRFVIAMDDPQWAAPDVSPTGGLGSSTMSGCGAPGGPKGGILVPGSSSSSGPPPLAVTGAQAYSTASYPVLVDPIGFLANAVSASGSWWVGTVPDPATGAPPWRIPRRPLYVRDTTATMVPPPWIPLGFASLNGSGGTQARSNLPIFKQFSLMDDMTFTTGGVPYIPSNAIERQGRYSWAYMFRRAHNADRTAVDMTTILYSGRSIDVPSQETTYPGNGVPASLAVATNRNPKELLISYGSSPKPAIRRGSWVLDATLWNYDSNGKLTRPDPQGYFYRVVNVDDSVAGVLALELQTPLLGGPLPPKNGNTFNRAIVVMDKVIEVFTKTDVARVAPQMPY
jgi:hypothetical protein